MTVLRPTLLVSFFSLALLAASCNRGQSNVETVPSNLLKDNSVDAKDVTVKEKPPITSKSTGRDDLAYYPPPADAVETETGVKYVYLAKGSGTEHPSGRSEVKVHYEGRTTDGKVFDSSVARGQPAVLTLNQVIEGWREGVKLMKEGDKLRLWIPENLAYKGQEGAPQGMLIFDIELLEIVSTPRPGE
jgi:peptidylprolyl isomerase